MTGRTDLFDTLGGEFKLLQLQNEYGLSAEEIRKRLYDPVPNPELYEVRDADADNNTVAKANARIPEVFGSPYFPPDRLCPVDHIYLRVLSQIQKWFVVSRGEVDILGVADGWQPLAAPNQTWQMFAPGDPLPSGVFYPRPTGIQKVDIPDPLVGGWTPIVEMNCRGTDRFIFDISFPNGFGVMQQRNTFNPVDVELEWQWRELLPNQAGWGPWVQNNVGIFDYTYDGIPYRHTFTQVLQAHQQDRTIQFQIRRTNPKGINDNNNTYYDDATLVRVAPYIPLNTLYSDVTILRVQYTDVYYKDWEDKVRSVVQCQAFRKLREVLPGGVTLPRNTRECSAALLEIATATGQYSYGDIDFASLAASQSEADRYQSGDVSVVLRNERSVDEELAEIANVSRIVPYQRDRIIRFYADYQKPPKTYAALINSRTKSERAERRTLGVSQLDDADGVELSFFPSGRHDSGTVIVPSTIPRPDRPKKVQLNGIQNQDTARRRAWYEYNRIRLQRDSIQVEVAEDAELLNVNDLVLVSDAIGTATAWEGEVLFMDPTFTTLTLDRDIPANVAVGATIYVRSIGGKIEVEFQTIASKVGPAQYTLQAALTNPGLPSARNQLNWIWALDVGNLRPYLVAEIGPTDRGLTTLRLIEYDEDVYFYDINPLPPP